MLTDKQIKNLKPGDPLIIHGKFDRIFKNGDIGIEVDITCGEGGGVTKDTKYVHPSRVSLPSVKPIEMSNTTKIPEEHPKYDPCRKFKEGDIVGYHRRFGRDYKTVPDPGDYKLARVILAEDEESGMVGVEFSETYGGDAVCFSAPWFHLELVTPVEEPEPYSVLESDAFDIVRDGKVVMTIPFTVDDYYDFEQAQAAAEDWCKRLNAEWIKTLNLN